MWPDSIIFFSFNQTESERAMTISEMLLPEFDQEMTNTRSVLERVPIDKIAWKPHDRSMTLGRLAGHIAELPSWAGRVLNAEMVDITPMVSGRYQPFMPSTLEFLLKKFDQDALDARNALAKASDQHLIQTWSMQIHGKTIASGPRLQMIRSVFLNHLIHHRAQLGVYLRLNDIPLPPLYGPSADEGKSF
jgi:uncharacterized damage-inducible protein DinB